jgi:hypothetical protein
MGPAAKGKTSPAAKGADLPRAPDPKVAHARRAKHTVGLAIAAPERCFDVIAAACSKIPQQGIPVEEVLVNVGMLFFVFTHRIDASDTRTLYLDAYGSLLDADIDDGTTRRTITAEQPLDTTDETTEIRARHVAELIMLFIGSPRHKQAILMVKVPESQQETMILDYIRAKHFAVSTPIPNRNTSWHTVGPSIVTPYW